MEIIVYTKPNCQPCKATKRLLERSGTIYREEPVSDENKALILALGYQSAPVIVVYQNGEIMDSWAGFIPDKVNDLLISENFIIKRS